MGQLSLNLTTLAMLFTRAWIPFMTAFTDLRRLRQQQQSLLRTEFSGEVVGAEEATIMMSMAMMMQRIVMTEDVDDTQRCSRCAALGRGERIFCSS